jgi:4-amino-4-deoxy-L-arabinose transferase-like glycosyltransferase
MRTTNTKIENKNCGLKNCGLFLTLPNVNRNKFNSIIKNGLPMIILLVVSYFSLFYKLGAAEMQAWDESSYALNAQEMLERGAPFRMYLNGQPELYNTKPPFAVWCMAISMKVFGFNEFAARFPSALFAFGAVLLLYFTIKKLTQNNWIALFAPLVLLSNTGFIGVHAARAGDTDAILAVWILVYCISFFRFTVSTTNKDKNIWLFVTCLGVSLACFTKGIAGLTAIPGLILWGFYTQKIRSVVTNKYFYFGLICFIVIVPGYYFLRDHLTPGYIKTVLHYEFLGRVERQEFLNPEPRSFFYFFQAMFNEGRLVGWIYILPVSIIIILFSKGSYLKLISIFFACALLGVTLSLGLSTTKLFWYDAPLHPLIAAVIGCSFALLIQQFNYPLFIGLGFVVLFVYPFKIIAKRNLAYTPNQHCREALGYIRNELKEKDTIYLVEVDFNFSFHFYIKKDLINGNITRFVAPNDTVLKPGRKILTCKYEREVDVNNLFTFDTLYRNEDCSYYKIVDYKKKETK